MTAQELIDRMRKNVEAQRPYQLGNDIEVAVAMDKTVSNSTCAENPAGVKEVLIGRLDVPPKCVIVFLIGATPGHHNGRRKPGDRLVHNR